MLYAHSHSGGATQGLATKAHSRPLSHGVALRSARDLPVVAAALFIVVLLWAVLAQPLHPKFGGAEGAQGCVYLGRAGSHCPEHSGADARNGDEQNCVFLGRAGKYCAPEPSSH